MGLEDISLSLSLALLCTVKHTVVSLAGKKVPLRKPRLDFGHSVVVTVRERVEGLLLLLFRSLLPFSHYTPSRL